MTVAQDSSNTIEKMWTNNNSESVNNLLKLCVDWKPQKLLNLVNHLHDLVKMQNIDLMRSLFGQGNYQLTTSPFAWHRVKNSVWMTANESKRKLIFDGFLKENGTKCSHATLSSTDGLLTVNASPKVAKKPGQRTRSRSHKTSKKNFYIANKCLGIVDII